MKIQKILVPTDFSRESRAALYDALSLAQRVSATVDMIHVLDSTSLAEESVGWSARKGEARPRAEAKASFATAGFLHELESMGIHVRSSMKRGPIAETIASVARDEDYDIIVMGCDGKRAGLISEVVRCSSIPVLVTRLDDSDALCAVM